MLLPILFLAGLVSCAVIAPRQTPTSFPLPEPCTGSACEHYGDASIVISNGQYYRFSKNNSTGLGLEVALSSSLRGPWEYRPGLVLSGPIKDSVAGTTPAERAHTNLWAPEIHHINDMWYLFYGVERPNISRADGGFDIAVATTTDLDGNWTDHGSIGIPALPRGSSHRIWTKLGATLLVNASDPSGQAIDPHFLAFGSYETGLFGIKMRGPPLHVVTDAQPVKLIADQPIPKVDGNTRINRTEGPYMYKRNNTQYFIFYSVGENSPPPKAELGIVYRVEVCRAEQAVGPYFDANQRNCLDVVTPYGPSQPGTVVLKTHSDRQVFAPGSVGILDDPVEGLVMYYQYINATEGNKNGGHTFGFNYLEFDQDGWPMLVSTRPTKKE